MLKKPTLLVQVRTKKKKKIVILRLHLTCTPYVKIINEASCWRLCLLKHDPASGPSFSICSLENYMQQKLTSGKGT